MKENMMKRGRVEWGQKKGRRGGEEVKEASLYLRWAGHVNLLINQLRKREFKGRKFVEGVKSDSKISQIALRQLRVIETFICENLIF